MSLIQFTSRRLRIASAVATAVAVGPLSLLLTMPDASAGVVAHDRTSALEALRVDRVKAPRFDWFRCTEAGAECATIRLPLDYDQPGGPTTEVAVTRVRAAKPKQRIGTLFVNPGGPGGSATKMAAAASLFLDPKLLDRFDIVGVDPRGIGFSENVTCFRNTGVRADALAGYVSRFPVTSAQEKAYIRSSRALAKGCGTTGRPLAASMSTAEVARDMDVVRRALGDRKLNFLGFSYGTQLGQVYANMFPDRVRAVVVDGVIDPVAWTTGRAAAGRTVPVDDRLRSADASYRALREYMSRCDKAGVAQCPFAGRGGSLRKYDALAKRLKATPVRLTEPEVGDEKATFGYAELVGITLSGLYDQGLGLPLANLLQIVEKASNPSTPTAPKAAAARRASAAVRTLKASLAPQQVAVGWPGRGFPYDNNIDTYVSVLCSDSVNPSNPAAWGPTSAAADKRAPYFGKAWAWTSNACASSIWTARDEDRYMGPFTRRTAAPVLVVGNYYDPATSYRDGAVPAAALLPNSRLLTSNSWGHTAYGTSPCIVDAVGRYLLDGKLPAKGTVCVGFQPFDNPAAASARAATAARPAPIQPFVPPAIG